MCKRSFKRYTILIILLIPSLLYALTGNEMESIAQTYLSYSWPCNILNAREKNRDDNPINNDKDHPFFPMGAAMKLVDGTTVYQTNPNYTGEAYGWGLIEDTDDFETKLSTHQAGSLHIYDPNIYTGIDCSGFVGRSTGIDFVKVKCDHLMMANLTDPIDWNDVVKGDILVKSSHVALVTGRSGDTANVIESAWFYGTEDSLNGCRVMSNNYTKAGGVIKRENDPNGSHGYSPRRFTPPILRRVIIRKKATNEIIYQGNWTTNAANRTLTQTANNLLIPAKPGDTILFELQFSKVCAWKWPDGNAKNLDITVTCGRKTPYTEYTIAPIANGDGGWNLSDTYWQTSVYKTWTGELVVPNDNSYNGFYHLRVKARSVTNCDLDSNLNPFFVVKLAVVKTA